MYNRVFFLLLMHFSLFSNPFIIDVLEKEQYTIADYKDLEAKIRALDILSYINEVYEPNVQLTHKLMEMISKGKYLKLLDEENISLPIVRFEKIGKGSDNCIVSYCSFNKNYSSLITTISQSLEDLGFNGYFLYQIGGYPNPTGKEMKYVSVPYSFKIFMMLEAKKRGFDKVLWIDSAYHPLRDPTPLFEWIQSNEILISGPILRYQKASRLVPEKTALVIKDLIGVDLLDREEEKTLHVKGGEFGMLMNSDKCKEVVKKYYEFVSIGTPFISLRPEEMVLTAIVNKIFGSKLIEHSFKRSGQEHKLKQDMHFFYIRGH